jgi:hypothetical protein
MTIQEFEWEMVSAENVSLMYGGQHWRFVDPVAQKSTASLERGFAVSRLWEQDVLLSGCLILPMNEFCLYDDRVMKVPTEILQVKCS